MERKELSWIGSSGTTKTIESLADTTPDGNGVAFGAAVGVDTGGGVLVACRTWGATVGASATPPQATANIATKPSNANGQLFNAFAYFMESSRKENDHGRLKEYSYQGTGSRAAPGTKPFRLHWSCYRKGCPKQWRL